jgi:hypothetical protein
MGEEVIGTYIRPLSVGTTKGRGTQGSKRIETSREMATKDSESPDCVFDEAVGMPTICGGDTARLS